MKHKIRVFCWYINQQRSPVPHHHFIQNVKSKWSTQLMYSVSIYVSSSVCPHFVVLHSMSEWWRCTPTTDKQNRWSAAALNTILNMVWKWCKEWCVKVAISTCLPISVHCLSNIVRVSVLCEVIVKTLEHLVCLIKWLLNINDDLHLQMYTTWRYFWRPSQK
jgi:hypothetical protein